MHVFLVSLNSLSNRICSPPRVSWYTGTFRKSSGGFRMSWRGCTKTTRLVEQTRPNTEVRWSPYWVASQSFSQFKPQTFLTINWLLISGSLKVSSKDIGK